MSKTNELMKKACILLVPLKYVYHDARLRKSKVYKHMIWIYQYRGQN